MKWYRSYTIAKGDTLHKIARAEETSVEAILAANDIADPNLIHVGDTLRLPAGDFIRFVKSDYTYDDAAALAALWGADLGETKAKIGRKIGWGNEKILDAELSTARDWQGFVKSPYSFEDAELLATLWGGEVWDNKLLIGRKIGWGNQKLIDEALGIHRFDKSPYTFDDAELLAGFWGGTVWDAKIRIGLSSTQEVNEALAVSTFDKSGYSFEDAEVLAGYWGDSVWAGKVKIGGLVRDGLGNKVDLALDEARGGGC